MWQYQFQLLRLWWGLLSGSSEAILVGVAAVVESPTPQLPSSPPLLAGALKLVELVVGWERWVLMGGGVGRGTGQCAKSLQLHSSVTGRLVVSSDQIFWLCTKYPAGQQCQTKLCDLLLQTSMVGNTSDLTKLINTDHVLET